MIQKTRKPTKAAVVVEQLQGDILSGRIAPEQRLPMEVLKQRYGISGSPLREALSRLVANGLVQVEEQCGFCVAPLSLDELHDIYMVRSEIECMALELAIKNGDDQWEADILASWHTFSKYIDPRINKNIEPAKWDVLQREFLLSLVKGCNSPWLLKIRNMLWDQAARYRVVCLNANYQDEKILLKMLKDNERLVTAVLTRDLDAASKETRQIYEASVKFISEALAKSRSEQVSKASSKDAYHKRRNMRREHQ